MFQGAESTSFLGLEASAVWERPTGPISPPKHRLSPVLIRSEDGILPANRLSLV